MEEAIIKVTLNEDEQLLELLNRMIAVKSEKNKDVECELDGEIITTKDCLNLSDMLVKNHSFIFEGMTKDREILLNTNTMKNEIEKFQNRVINYNEIVGNLNERTTMNWQIEREFAKKLDELKNLNYSDTVSVFNWLLSIAEYINNLNLSIPNEYIKHIIKQFENNGYFSKPKEVNSVEDFYKTLISGEISDLDTYGFLIYDYADNLRKMNLITAEEMEQSAKEIESKNKETVIDQTVVDKAINELQEDNKKIMYNLKTLEKYSNGEYDDNKQKTESYQVRINKLKEKVDKLNKEDTMTDYVPSGTFEESIESKIQLESAVYQSNIALTDEEVKALQSYYVLLSSPTLEKVTTALKKASELPITSIAKIPLVHAIITTGFANPELNNEFDRTKLQQSMQELNLQTLMNENYSTNSNQKEINEINNEIEEINKEWEKKKEVYKVESETLKLLIKKNMDRIEEIKNNPQILFSNDLEDIKETQDKHNAEKTEDTINQTEKPSETTKEAIPSVPSVEIAGEPTDYTIPTFKEDCFRKPCIIQSKTKAPSKLIEKVRSIEFKQIIKKVLDWAKENKNAVILSVVILGSIPIAMHIPNARDSSNVPAETNSTSLEEDNNNNKEKSPIEKINPTNYKEEENEVQQETIIEQTESVDASSPTITVNVDDNNKVNFDEQLMKSIDKVINGEEGVYTTSSNALTDTNEKKPNERQINNSWIMAEPTAYYDETGLITEEQAQKKVENGERVAVQMQNDRGTAGYINIGKNDTDNNQKISR